MKKKIFIKCIVIAVATASVVALLAFSSARISKAGSDVILSEIAKYKTWKKVNEKPVAAPSTTATDNTDSNKTPAFTLEGQGG